MGLFDSITGWIRKESADVGAALGDATESLDRDLARKERELAATPEERFAMIQDQIDDDPFAAIRGRIEATTAHADAESDVDAIDGPVLDGSDSVGGDMSSAGDLEGAEDLEEAEDLEAEPSEGSDLESSGGDDDR